MTWSSRDSSGVRQMARARPHHFTVGATMVLCASILWILVGLGGVPAHGATWHATAGGGQHTTASPGVPTGHASDVVHGHKEGPLAVAFSVIGVIVVVVLIVALGSISVRRRTRDGLPPGRREPPDRRRGLFG
jgi:hypothetical protein